MALNEGVVAENSTFFCGGSIEVTGRTTPLNCWKTIGHGLQTLTQRSSTPATSLSFRSASS
jgi:stage V sporulation protein D (sporulation-specific penicillin-binding protein)